MPLLSFTLFREPCSSKFDLYTNRGRGEERWGKQQSEEMDKREEKEPGQEGRKERREKRGRKESAESE